MPYPRGAMAVDGLGNVYIADHGVSDWFVGYTSITKITPQGVVSSLARTAGVQGSVDGVGSAASFTSATHLTVDAAGNVYVVDRRRAVDAYGVVYLVDRGHRIRKITPSGVVTTLGRNGAATTPGDNGFDDDLHGGYGLGEAVRFGEIASLVALPTGEIYVGEELRVGDTSPGQIRRISPSGVVTTVAGTRLSSGITLGSLPGSLSELRSLAVDTNGTLYVVTEGAVLKIQFPP